MKSKYMITLFQFSKLVLITSSLKRSIAKISEIHTLYVTDLEFTRIMLSPSPIMPFCLCVFCWLVFVFEINMNVNPYTKLQYFQLWFFMACCSQQLLLLYFYPWLLGS